MTYPCTAPSSLEQGLVVIRRLRSINSAQLGIVTQALAPFAANWQAASHDDYDGYLSIIVSSEQENAPTFAITGKTDAIELYEMRDDDLHSQGCFSTMDHTADMLVGLLQSIQLPDTGRIACPAPTR